MMFIASKSWQRHIHKTVRQRMMRNYSTLACVCLLLITSCSRAPRLKFFNNTGADITITVDAGKTTIANGTSEKVWFPNKSFAMQIEADQQRWSYSLGGYPPRDYCKPTAASIVHVQLEPDGRVYVFLPGTRLPQNDLSGQPEGFPLKPTTKEGTAEPEN